MRGAHQEAGHVPVRPPADALKLPEDTLKLEFVHGYRAHDVRANLAYDARGCLVFPAAALGVVMDPKTRMQRFFDLHTDDVLALAMHPTGAVVATSQVGDGSPIHVWRTADCARVATIFPKHGKATLHLAFSADGYNLAAVGADELHTVSVYDWESNAQKKNFEPRTRTFPTRRTTPGSSWRASNSDARRRTSSSSTRWTGGS